MSEEVTLKAKKKAKKKPRIKPHVIISIKGGEYDGAVANIKGVKVDHFNWDEESRKDAMHGAELDDIKDTIEEMERKRVKETTVKPLRSTLEKMEKDFVPAHKRWLKLIEGMVPIG